MPVNNFKSFSTANNANVISQADYEALAALAGGFTAGKASSAQINKTLRQGTVMSSVLAQFIANFSGNDVLDNGDTTTILNNLIIALATNGSNNFLQILNSLSEIKAAGNTAQVSARTNLGLGNSATLNTGTGAGTVATGNDSRITGAAQKANNLSDLVNATSARSNLGLGTAATAAVGTGTNQIPDMNSFTSSSSWLKLPSGKIIQWFQVSTSTTAAVQANFPIQFPNGARSIIVSATDQTGPNTAAVAIFTASQCLVSAWDSNKVRTSTNVFVTAIGD